MSAPQPTTVAAVSKTSGGNAAYHNFHNDFVRSVAPFPGHICTPILINP